MIFRLTDWLFHIFFNSLYSSSLKLQYSVWRSGRASCYSMWCTCQSNGNKKNWAKFQPHFLKNHPDSVVTLGNFLPTLKFCAFEQSFSIFVFPWQKQLTHRQFIEVLSVTVIRTGQLRKNHTCKDHHGALALAGATTRHSLDEHAGFCVCTSATETNNSNRQHVRYWERTV